MKKKSIIPLLLLLVATAVALVVVIRLPGTYPEQIPTAHITDEAAEGVTSTDIEERDEIPSETKRLYLILDDGGHNIEDFRSYSAFPGRFTVAVLPRREFSDEVARMAVAMGHEVILHQPMEPMGTANPGPGAIYIADDDETIRKTLDKNLDSLPQAVGINNHMGSRATADRRVMAVVVDELSKREIFFLDSRTSAESVGVEVATEHGLTAFQRDVFLDNERTNEAIGNQLDEALEIADEYGSVVMIGHITSPELAAVLIDRYDELVEAGYTFEVLR